MTAPVLSISGLSVTAADGSPVLRDVSIEVRPGQAVGLVGSSGSGKTVTALAGIGMLPRGLRRVRGRTTAVSRSTDAPAPPALRQMLRRDIGYVPQDPLAALDPLFPIGDQVTEPGRLARGRGWREVGRAWGLPVGGASIAPAKALLERVEIASAAERARQFPHQFSGGMRQRALIAAATSLSPRLVIADEPTTALDASLERTILDLLRRTVQASGGALLLISHDLNLIAWYCDYAYVMAAGAVVEHGPTERLFRHPAQPETRRLLQSAPVFGLATPPDPARMPPGREILLELQGVSRAYPLAGGRRVPACDSVDLVVHRSELVSLVGESGSGKSSLARIALGLEAPDAGAVLFAGASLASLSPSALRRQRRWFQPIFQDPLSSLNPRWRLGRAILHPLRVNGLCGWRNLEEALATLMDEVELSPALATRFPHEVSGGQRQRACIARALATRPDLLVADEALSALDVTTQASILVLFERLRARGMAILFISHDLRTVRRISDRIAVMARGRIVECASPAAVFEAPADPYTAKLVASLMPPRFPLPTERLAP